MVRIDRQIPQGDEIFYDHIGYFVSDLEDAGTKLEKLGFQISNINIQYNQDAQGILHLTGTSNRVAKLNRGYIEVLAATSKTSLSDQLTNMLARYQGLHVIALTNPDMQKTGLRLKAAGVEMQNPVHMRRKIKLKGKETMLAFTILRAKPGTYAEGRLQILTNHTPENFWLTGEMDHNNQANALTDLLICVKDVEETVDRYENFFGKTSTRVSGLHTLQLDRGQFHFVSPKQATMFLPGFSPPVLPYTCGQGLLSKDLKVTEAYFAENCIAPIYKDDNLICIGPADALGAYLIFHSKNVDAPWALLFNRS